MSESPGNATRYALEPIVWDLWLVGLFTLFLAILALIPGTAGHPIRIAMAIGFVLFIPGYAFISAIFPEAATEEEQDSPGGRTNTDSPEGEAPTRQGIDGIERLAFGFGLSVALTALIALGLNFTPWGIRLLPLVVSLSTFTIASLFIAGFRRMRILRESSTVNRTGSTQAAHREPFIPPFHRIPPLVRDVRDEVFGRNTDSRTEKLLTIALVISILLAAASIGWALTTPRPGEDYTEFYLLTRDDGGELVAGGYPTNLSTQDTSRVVLTVNNHEFKTVSYTVRIQLRNPTTGRTERMQTIQNIRLGHNATWQETISLVPPFTGNDLRLEFLLYRDDATSSEVYRRLHLIVNVSN